MSACCDWCGSSSGEMVRVADDIDGAPAHACRPCWGSDGLTLLRAVVTARRELHAQTPGSLERAEAMAQAVRRALAQQAEAIPLAPLEVTGQDVRPGDGLTIGGRTFLVVRRIPVTGGVKLRFLSGELLAVHRHTRLAVMRPAPERKPW